jgi:hypothetical protein
MLSHYGFPDHYLEFDEFFEASNVQAGIGNWLDSVAKKLKDSDKWCVVISAYTDDSSLVSSLGNYLLYCGYYRLNIDNKFAHHYTESQFRKDDICTDVNLHSSWIVLKKFWEPDGANEFNEVFKDSRRLRSISVGENSMFGANEKTVLWFDIKGKRVSIEIIGKWNSMVKEQLVDLFGNKLTNTIKHLVDKANDYRSKGLRIEVEM